MKWIELYMKKYPGKSVLDAIAESCPGKEFEGCDIRSSVLKCSVSAEDTIPAMCRECWEGEADPEVVLRNMPSRAEPLFVAPTKMVPEKVKLILDIGPGLRKYLQSWYGGTPAEVRARLFDETITPLHRKALREIFGEAQAEEKATVWHDLKRDGYPKQPYDPRGYLCICHYYPDLYHTSYSVLHFLPGVGNDKPRFEGEEDKEDYGRTVERWTELPEEPEEGGNDGE